MSTSFNISKGKIQWYFEQAAAGGGKAIIASLWQTTGLDADSVLKDMDTMAQVAAANTKASFTNYADKTLTGAQVTVTVDDSADSVKLDLEDMTWTDAGAGQTLGKLILAYDPATGTGTDADLVPLLAYDLSATTDGNDLIVRFHTNGAAVVS